MGTVVPDTLAITRSDDAALGPDPAVRVQRASRAVETVSEPKEHAALSLADPVVLMVVHVTNESTTPEWNSRRGTSEKSDVHVWGSIGHSLGEGRQANKILVNKKILVGPPEGHAEGVTICHMDGDLKVSRAPPGKE
jgi:hypothetical protein